GRWRGGGERSSRPPRPSRKGNEQSRKKLIDRPLSGSIGCRQINPGRRVEPSKDRGCRRNAFPIRVALALALLILATAPALLAQSDWIGPEALAQMKAIADDKRARTPP